MQEKREQASAGRCRGEMISAQASCLNFNSFSFSGLSYKFKPKPKLNEF
jgi:hypothetical protein